MEQDNLKQFVGDEAHLETSEFPLGDLDSMVFAATNDYSYDYAGNSEALSTSPLPELDANYPLGPLNTPVEEHADAMFFPSTLDAYRDASLTFPFDQSLWHPTSVDTGAWVGGQICNNYSYPPPDGFSAFPPAHHDPAAETASLSLVSAPATIIAAGIHTAAELAARPEHIPVLLDLAPAITKTTLEKPKKKRGRPRFYQDDGTDLDTTRRKPTGRPPGSTVGSSSTPGQSMLPRPQQQQLLTGATSPWLSSRETSGLGTTTTGFSHHSSINTDYSSSSNNPTSASFVTNDNSKQETVRARNKAAATRYRHKTQAAIASMEAGEREVSLTRQALLVTAGELKNEVFQLKTELLRHADCGCPLITGYLAGAVGQAYASLLSPLDQQQPQVPPAWRMGRIGGEGGVGIMGSENTGGGGKGEGAFLNLGSDGGLYVNHQEECTHQSGGGSGQNQGEGLSQSLSLSPSQAHQGGRLDLASQDGGNYSINTRMGSSLSAWLGGGLCHGPNTYHHQQQQQHYTGGEPMEVDDRGYDDDSEGA